MRQNQLKYKIKREPKDFIVKEVAHFNLSSHGKFSYYILEKENRNTLDVLEEISVKLGIPLFEFGFSGLKDKRAKTFQYISIKGGPQTKLIGRGWKLKFIGKGEKGIEMGEAEGNYFIVKIYDIDPKRFEEGINLIKDIGIANYFGEQRFSCDLYSHQPIGRLLLEGKVYEALKEYFTQSPDPFKRQKLKRLWGKWQPFLIEAPHLSKREKAAIKVLMKKKNPLQAFKVLPKNIKLMFFFSYQSMLWNRMLKRVIKKHLPHFTVPFVIDGKLYFYKKRTEFFNNVLRDLEIPYISEEALKSSPEILKEEINKIIEEEKLADKLNREIENIKAFSWGKRKAVVFPQKLKIIERGGNWARIKFFLPSGSYATILLRKAFYFTP